MKYNVYHNKYLKSFHFFFCTFSSFFLSFQIVIHMYISNAIVFLDIIEYS